MPTTKVPASRMVDHNIGSYCFRNKIINGEFKIWQRGTSQNTTGYGSADRWKIDVFTGMSTFVQQTNNIGGCAFFANNSTNRIVLAQTLEDSQIAGLLGNTATFSFLANTSGVTQTLTAYIQKSVTANNSAAANWVTITSTAFTIPPNTTDRYSISGIIPNDGTANGLRVAFESNNIPNGSGIGIFLAQLEVGPTATPFEYRPIGTELALCQRYYCKTYPQNVKPGTADNVYTGMRGIVPPTSNWTHLAPFIFPVTMRTFSGYTYGVNVFLYNPKTGTLGTSDGTYISNPIFCDNNGTNYRASYMITQSALFVNVGGQAVPSDFGIYLHAAVDVEL